MLFPFAQQRESITKTTKIQQYKIKEECQVLNADISVKDVYYKYYIDNKLSAESYYSIGKKDSVWKKYISSTGTLLASKLYKLGKRIGKWDFFD
jgi:antitoxin component YwqK of YwqJK toxin-antitoxin module